MIALIRSAWGRDIVEDRMIVPRCLRCVPRLIVAALLVLLVARPARAEESVEQIAERLRSAQDFRVRVQAALALGASQTPNAVGPLCAGLDDPNATVRSAAAAALGRLRQSGGLECLRRKGSGESNASVQSQIQRSIRQIELSPSTSASALSRAPDARSKWYVAVGPTSSKGDRSGAELDALVQQAIRSALAGHPNMAIAPTSETDAQAQAVLQKHKLAGYYLQATVEAPQYQDSKLTITVRITMLGYPNKALQGEFAPKLTQSGTPSKDRASEDELIRMAVARAIARFISVVEVSKR